MVGAHIIVGGKVQGVSFRWFVQREAGRFNLVGTVRNLPGGDVEVYAEGTRQEIEKLIDAMKKGNGASRVDQCRVVWGASDRKYDGFEIIIGGW